MPNGATLGVPIVVRPLSDASFPGGLVPCARSSPPASWCRCSASRRPWRAPGLTPAGGAEGPASDVRVLGAEYEPVSLADLDELDDPDPLPVPDDAAVEALAVAPEAPATVATVAVPVEPASKSGPQGIPLAALRAYQRAAAAINRTDPGCRIPWQLLAAVGRAESNHGRYGGSVMTASGKATPPIIGIALDGRGPVALILDSEGGAWDADPVYDRAIGPMQFLPGTWRTNGRDGDKDGVKDPHDIDDAALAAAVYLCAGPGDLSTIEGQRAAVFRYNRSEPYVEFVVTKAAEYAGQGVVAVPNGVPAPAPAPAPADVPPAPGEPAPVPSADPTGSPSPSREPVAERRADAHRHPDAHRRAHPDRDADSDRDAARPRGRPAPIRRPPRPRARPRPPPPSPQRCGGPPSRIRVGRAPPAWGCGRGKAQRASRRAASVAQ